MPEENAQTTQPLEMKVDPRRWTTKVNVAMVVAVVVVLLIGAGYAVYALLRPAEVQRDIHEDVTAPAPTP